MNNDRFKFRFYNKKENKYFYPDVYDNHMVNRVGFMAKWKKHFYNSCADDFIVEQCTGLKDKNGKLIYEGDCVKVYFNNEYITNVFWDKDYCAFGVSICPDSIITFDMIDLNKLEIIGNIHEVKE